MEILVPEEGKQKSRTTFSQHLNCKSIAEEYFKDGQVSFSTDISETICSI